MPASGRRVWVLLNVAGYSEGTQVVGVVTNEDAAKQWAGDWGTYRDYEEFELDEIPGREDA